MGGSPGGITKAGGSTADGSCGVIVGFIEAGRAGLHLRSPRKTALYSTRVGAAHADHYQWIVSFASSPPRGRSDPAFDPPDWNALTLYLPGGR
jgi:hypothetical protein